VNIDGAVLGLRAVLPAMVRRKEGAVVLTASLSGLSPLPSDPLYSASKHFIVGLMRSVALQLSETGVRVMALCPGATDTPIIKSPRRKDLNLLNPRDVATSLVNLLESGVTGTALAVMVGQPVVPWAFKDIPTKSRPGAEREYHA
jgi:short-subunit dehydrogenase